MMAKQVPLKQTASYRCLKPDQVHQRYQKVHLSKNSSSHLGGLESKSLIRLWCCASVFQTVSCHNNVYWNVLMLAACRTPCSISTNYSALLVFSHFSSWLFLHRGAKKLFYSPSLRIHTQFTPSLFIATVLSHSLCPLFSSSTTCIWSANYRAGQQSWHNTQEMH